MNANLPTSQQLAFIAGMNGVAFGETFEQGFDDYRYSVSMCMDDHKRVQLIVTHVNNPNVYTLVDRGWWTPSHHALDSLQTACHLAANAMHEHAAAATFHPVSTRAHGVQ
jgi:hypothetical protein